jgi:hypothetical protein
MKIPCFPVVFNTTLNTCTNMYTLDYEIWIDGTAYEIWPSDTHSPSTTLNTRTPSTALTHTGKPPSLIMDQVIA